MLQLPGYQVLDPLYVGANSTVFRGCRLADGYPVILKALQLKSRDPFEQSRYRQEYDLLQFLTPIEGVIQVYDWSLHQQVPVIVCEDFGGQSLEDFLVQQPLSLEQFFPIAIAIAQILGEVHAAQVIHKDINPSNILIHPQTQVVKLIDFGIATLLTRENPAIKNPNGLEGTLAYLSPEQTGRMNRQVDYRTDFYSLGATFYRLLTRQFPFEAKDALELVHCHLARLPLPVHELNVAVPPMLSAIVGKLMAKTAEDRYQSAWGIQADLETCWQQWQKNRTIVAFSLGQQDVSSQFQIPQKLYGRDGDIQQLLAAFDRVASPVETRVAGQTGVSELVLVTGFSGIGKSALVQEVYKPLTQRRGYLISGKFDQVQRNIPYRGFMTALSSLIQELLSETEAELQAWRSRLQTALGQNGQVIVDVIPEVELIVGSQPPLVDLEPAEAQNRFNLVFQNFIQVFAQVEHPLVLFLDDLQWADSASLKLIQRLMVGDDQQNLLLIGAYRSNEVNANHPLQLAIEEIQKAQGQISRIVLKPLCLEDVQQLIADTVKTSIEAVQDLAQLVLQKTEGNPFFLNEFLKTLYTQKLIDFDTRQGKWEWDCTQIQNCGITDNVVELMTQRIQQLPSRTQKALQMAACIGAQFDLNSLAIVMHQSCKQTLQDLWDAISVELLYAIDRPVHPETLEDESLTSVFEGQLRYRFVHDRIQQAAYGLIPEPDKQRIHWQIGQLLLVQTTQEQQEQKLFELLNHLNLGRSLLTSESQRQQLIQLNVEAGIKAKNSAAYEPALQYFETALELCCDQDWQDQFDLAWQVHRETAEACCICSQFDRMNQLAAIALSQEQDVWKQAEIQTICIQAAIMQNQPLQAIQMAHRVLRQMGLRLPKKPNQGHVIWQMLITQAKLARKTPQMLLELPEMQDPKMDMMLSLMGRVGAASYFAYPEFTSIQMFKAIQIALNHGTHTNSSGNYATYGLVLCGILGKIPEGYKFGKLGMDLAKKRQLSSSYVMTQFVFNFLIRHWQDPLYSLMPEFTEGYQNALAVGNLEYAAYFLFSRCNLKFLSGRDTLIDLMQELKTSTETIDQLNQVATGRWIRATLQVVQNFLQPSEHPHLLQGEFYNLLDMQPLHEAANDRTIIFQAYFYQAMLAFHFRQWDTAIESIRLTKKFADSAVSSPVISILNFYESLTYLFCYPQSSKKQQKQLLKVVNANQKKLKEWARHNPNSCLHKFHLVEAERQRVLGNPIQAMHHYEQAIALAYDHGYCQEAALANELAGRFYLHLNQPIPAQVYLEKACADYQSWGAIAKVEWLRATYKDCLEPAGIVTQVRTTTINTISNTMTLSQGTLSTTDRGNFLDLDTVVKAAQVMTEEIVLDKLLSKLMQILIENMGAQIGYLILESKGKLYIEAEGSLNHEQITVLRGIPVEQSVSLSTAIVNYVARTGESMVLSDASDDRRFQQDPYIQHQHPKSVLCAPLVNQGRVSGYVYLENNLTVGAFTPDRLALLNVLSSQAAIAIENARLYTNLTELNNAYSRFVPRQFLQFLNKESVVDVQLGDQKQLEMSVLFSDIRSFTALSEQMTPEENFQFINDYLSQMEPVIIDHHGFIDKYIGDAIMALFGRSADDAVRAGIMMLRALDRFNKIRNQSGKSSIQIGVGINTGLLMLGTVGGYNRMDSTVISDAVNLASRIEGLTKTYGVNLLITEQTLQKLNDPAQYHIRKVDRVRVKGKSEVITVYEVFDADPDPLLEAKLAISDQFNQAILLYESGDLAKAMHEFVQCLMQNPSDLVVRHYLKDCMQRRFETVRDRQLAGEL
ncbi:AAA family ATPase [Alkalinema pantanalense CENA528]|uniref:AAA family ATPase n=1 Tax=Alkalinema pantanalense TaxID=1620705 RepID=UPI003D6E9440